jgi:hypothetical protein
MRALRAITLEAGAMTVNFRNGGVVRSRLRASAKKGYHVDLLRQPDLRLEACTFIPSEFSLL